MTSLNRATGDAISGMAEIAQSIGDILTTPIGTRVCRREYGSRVPELLDMPMNAATAALIRAATAGAIRRWEPRVKLTRVAFALPAPSTPEIFVEGQRIDLPTASAFAFPVSV